jgi:hypothetical protein
MTVAVRLASIVVSGTCLTTCVSHERVVALGQFHDSRLGVRNTLNCEEVTLTLQNEVELTGGECLQIDGAVEASLDGTPFNVVSRGAFVPAAATDAASSCTPPAFHLASLSPTLTSRIVVTDGVSTLELDVTALLAKRFFTLNGAMQAGKTSSWHGRGRPTCWIPLRGWPGRQNRELECTPRDRHVGYSKNDSNANSISSTISWLWSP